MSFFDWGKPSGGTSASPPPAFADVYGGSGGTYYAQQTPPDPISNPQQMAQGSVVPGSYPMARSTSQFASSGVDPFSSALSAYMLGAGPSLVALQGTQSRMLQNIASQQQLGGLGADALRLQYQQQLEDANTQLGQNSLQQQGLQGRLPYYDQLINLAQQMLASNMKQFGIQEDAAKLTNTKDQAALLSSSTAKGSLSAPGTGQQRGFLDKNLYNQLANIMENKNQATIGETKEELGYRQNQAETKNQIAQLQLQADNLGMKPHELQQTLDNGLAQLGLRNSMTVNDLMDGLAQNSLQAMQIYQAAIQNAGQWANAYGQLQTANG